MTVRAGRSFQLGLKKFALGQNKLGRFLLSPSSVRAVSRFSV